MTGGYGRILDWHEKHKAKEGAQVLARLKQKKARWGKAFGTWMEREFDDLQNVH